MSNDNDDMKKADHIAEVMRNLRDAYIETPRDREIRKGVNYVANRVIASRNGENIEARGFVGTGRAGAGKTRSFSEAFARHPAFPGFREKMPGAPLVSVKVPAPCTMMQLGRALLRETGFDLKSEKREHITWEMARAQLERTNTLCVHFDEVQNIVQSANVIESNKLRDVLKGFLNDIDYPVGLILTGLPALARFLQEDLQLRRRCHFITFPSLTLDDALWLHDAIAALCDIAGLKVEDADKNAMAARLMQASSGQFGFAIELVHEAIEEALMAEEPTKTLTIQHLKVVFAARAQYMPPSSPIIDDHSWDVDDAIDGSDNDIEEEEKERGPAKRRRKY